MIEVYRYYYFQKKEMIWFDIKIKNYRFAHLLGKAMLF